jgi:5,10-methylene-tetrahydrofolate dehydrogenase/methenyl tetrahydrofolate cyclohydrolase
LLKALTECAGVVKTTKEEQTKNETEMKDAFVALTKAISTLTSRIVGPEAMVVDGGTNSTSSDSTSTDA